MNPLSPTQLELVERIGVVHERHGMRPAAGRIIGLLLVSPVPELTFDEIRETLGLSKSATSTSLSFLQAVGSVTYITRPGDRKRYFRKCVDDWERSFIERGLKFLEVRHLFAEAARGHEEGSETAESLERMTGFLNHLAEAVERAYEEWAAEVHANSAR